MAKAQGEKGTIYAIGIPGAHVVKIGRTQGCVQRRLSALQVGHNAPLELLAHVKVEANVSRIEKTIHAFFKAERDRGEWFAIVIDQEQLEALVMRAIQYIADEEIRMAQQDVHHPSMAEDIEARTRRVEFGRRMKRLRMALGLSQVELAERSGIPQPALSRIERGTCHTLDIAMFAHLVQTLHTSGDYLLRIDTLCHEGLVSQKVVRFSHLTFRK